ncbi:MAG: hemerythrin domain-containing protein [Candidatus Thiodiazotropha sp. (ex Dulcina madagascariensis)]|nr:hemerythrin domain-containing protein [Candidatus Thiodiazotropha sp. (ex Dulcina madagascariensis)]MCU7928488.1 hemerythrin domain-containing protein [Candidatus Thiodiazotropha sp. (ex Dulcina madagascariensis)]
MDDISQLFIQDHRRCDEMFVAMEQAFSQGEWSRAEKTLDGFIHAMEHHFNVEEERLFPVLEQASSQANGPVRVMMMEHVQMRHLFKTLCTAMQQRSKETILGITDTLLVTMQQHNMKEENILYPLADRFVAELGEEIAHGITESG